MAERYGLWKTHRRQCATSSSPNPGPPHPALQLCILFGGFTLHGMQDTSSSLRHIVVFKYKQGAPAAHIQQITDAFRALQQLIPGIRAFEQGVNISPEGSDQGFSHVYVLTFESAAARDAYLPHPQHKAFGELLGRLGIVEGVFVVDFAPAP